MKRFGVWRKGLFSGLLALCLVLGLFAGAPMTTYAANGGTIDLATVPSGDLSNDDWTFTYATNVYTILDGADVTITGTSTDLRRIVVADNATATITLDNAVIDMNVPLTTARAPITLGYGASVTLILANDSYLTSNGRAGIQTTDATLTIGGSGSLTAQGGSPSAGIGGSFNGSGGTVTITGGTVNATGSGGGAGIGGGRGYSGGGAGGSVTITGGTVTATGSSGGDSSSGSAGIGGGTGDGSTPIGGAGGSVTITGGTVTATGGAIGSGDGAGIGGSGSSSGTAGAGGSVTITGGTVTATGGFGIGGGDTVIGTAGAGGSVTITGGSVNASIQAQPTNDGTTPVYLNTLYKYNSSLANAVITDIYGVTYGITDVKADANGYLYFWLPATASSETIGVSTDGTIFYGADYQRATNNYNAQQLTLSLTREATPSAAIDYINVKLTGLVAGEKYTIGGEERTADGSGNIAIDSAWFDTALSIVKKARDTAYLDSAAQSLSIPTRPDVPSALSGVDETIQGRNDGKITGTTALMEWHTSQAATSGWTDCTATETTNFAPGTYYVRVKAVTSGTPAFASEAATVTIAGGIVPPTIVTTSLPNGTAGTAYSQTLTGTGANPITWNIDSGNLPGGLTLNTDGIITGNPTAAGTATFIVRATNGGGNDTRALSITIDPAPVDKTADPAPVDRSALNAALTTADNIAHGEVNTTQAWTNFVSARTAADDILNQTAPPATQAEIDTATANLSAAVSALKAYDNGFGFENGVNRYTIGSGVNLAHSIARDWSLHTGLVYVDGQRVTHGTHYTSAAGSTRTTLLASYLDTLSVGPHTLTVAFSSGIAPIVDTFEVVAGAAVSAGEGGGGAPATGDDSNTAALWVALICAALGMLCLIIWRKRQRMAAGK